MTSYLYGVPQKIGNQSGGWELARFGYECLTFYATQKRNGHWDVWKLESPVALTEDEQHTYCLEIEEFLYNPESEEETDSERWERLVMDAADSANENAELAELD